MNNNDFNWIMTHTGKHFHLLNPSVDEVDEVDIVHALTQICRFTGHTKEFYSVAMHSLLCLEEAKKNGESTLTQLHVLLHDTSEAYLTDVSKPLKNVLGNVYTDIEDKVMAVIYKYYNLPLPTYEETQKIKYYDMLLLYNEAKVLMPNVEEFGIPNFGTHVKIEFIGFSKEYISALFIRNLKRLIEDYKNEK